MNEKISKLPKEEADRVLELPNSYRERGIEIGETKGREENKKQMVVNMLKKGMSYELIAEIAEVDVHEVEEMSKELER